VTTFSQSPEILNLLFEAVSMMAKTLSTTFLLGEHQELGQSQQQMRWYRTDIRRGMEP